MTGKPQPSCNVVTPFAPNTPHPETTTTLCKTTSSIHPRQAEHIERTEGQGPYSGSCTYLLQRPISRLLETLLRKHNSLFLRSSWDNCLHRHYTFFQLLHQRQRTVSRTR
ncbi:hypothetical protein G7K_2084-t1 [Saitoella complicata NRRL Y-17804]|uniref:Uncharacterized protein n=1 Tax=Saitoella complicata (strain BCRC 22490 / CBS 7301 / JCM 7358 / NBRC 10748 / NRRL Y-17804) TaxID=698492 RepID=A0A0E9NDL5_SAICN|nr:hypothetical protein G7K_2084-t1 [Saitoella complicata NRRL Y-17804]